MPKSRAQKFRAALAKKSRKTFRYLKKQPPRKLALLAVGIPLALVAVLFVFLWIGVLTGAYGHIPTREELSKVETDNASSIFTEDGALLGKYYAINRLSVPADEISPYVTKALIATEDARFFEHQGIDVKALFRVAYRSVLMGDRSGGGGSTISQQLAN